MIHLLFFTSIYFNYIFSKEDVMNLLETAGFSRSNPYYIVQQGKVLIIIKEMIKLNSSLTYVIDKINIKKNLLLYNTIM
jgi:hypothetical protein